VPAGHVHRRLHVWVPLERLVHPAVELAELARVFAQQVGREFRQPGPNAPRIGRQVGRPQRADLAPPRKPLVRVHPHDRAVEDGVNWTDTAAVYGLGHSEEVVARALDGLRDRPYVFTKCGRVWNDRREIGRSLKADSIRRECEASLRRLRVERIDLYQIHWPEPEEDIEEGWTAMAALQREGKVRNIGVSNFNVAQMKRALAIAPITSLQPRYSLLHREIEKEILPFVARENIGVIAYSPMASGLLTGAMTPERTARLPADDWGRGHSDFREPQLSRNLRLVRLLHAIGSHHGRSPGEV